jgi:rSAM/selenodomain-associated transferase 1
MNAAENNGDKQLIVFVKAPRAGFVKTRLADSLGPDAACTAYCRLVEHSLRALKDLDSVQLRFTPNDALSEIEPWLAPHWTAASQGNGDLGERLHRAFAEAFAAGARRVVAIGSDCPDVSASDIEAAWMALRDCDVAIGPATDGGYWLLGLSAPHRELFQEIAWSSSTVFRETLARAGKASLEVQVLRELADVDSADDWKKFLSRQAGCKSEGKKEATPSRNGD